MIKWLFRHDFHFKKTLICLVTIWVIILVLILLVWPSNSMLEYQLFYEHYQIESKVIINQTLKICLPFLVLIMVMEHDQPYLRPLFAYFGVVKIQIYKYIMYYLVYSFVFAYLIIFVEAIKSYLPVAFSLTADDFNFYLQLYLDNMILMNMIFYFIRDKRRILSLLFGLLFYFISLYYEDSNSKIYYLLPLYHPHYKDFTFAIIYKLWYLLFGLCLCVRKNSMETIQ